MSDAKVIDPWKVLWDDATMTPIVVVGRESETCKTYYVERGSFEAVMLKAQEELEQRDQEASNGN